VGRGGREGRERRDAYQRFRHDAEEGEMPAVGDWVACVYSPTTARPASTLCCDASAESMARKTYRGWG
jgi:hypothetical protein